MREALPTNEKQIRGLRNISTRYLNCGKQTDKPPCLVLSLPYLSGNRIHLDSKTM